MCLRTSQRPVRKATSDSEVLRVVEGPDSGLELGEYHTKFTKSSAVGLVLL